MHSGGGGLPAALNHEETRMIAKESTGDVGSGEVHPAAQQQSFAG
jgi:hypothetical protein